MEALKGFFAYPAQPQRLGSTIETSIEVINDSDEELSIVPWKALDICGHFISEKVLEGIDYSDILFADITSLNFNVVYEIGYAIGKKKNIILVRNKSIVESEPKIREVGIFDTLGYAEYTSTDDLLSIITSSKESKSHDVSGSINTKAPVYLLDMKHKTDWATRIVSRIKKAGYIFRSFDPNESPRLAAYDAISHVTQSHGVVVPLLPIDSTGSGVSNMRAAFIAGLAEGMGKSVCILQEDEGPVPIDYRDLAKTTYSPSDVDEHIAEFASQVASSFQRGEQYKVEGPESFLRTIDLGASSAENEMRELELYYLKTDQFQKALRGEAHLVVGRKGAGKSAVFLQIRDRERNKGGNIVLDLKPEGYKLIKFKELILDYLEEGTFQHTIMALWEYILLLEICHKILAHDRRRHIHDSNLYKPYRKLAELYSSDDYTSEGDFSERLSMLMESISSRYTEKYSGKSRVRLSLPQITELLYRHDVKALSVEIIDYLKNKEVLWLLFDNIDKGWPTSGLKHEDLIVIRSLIDATRKIERTLGKRNIDVSTIIFLRNDVYELLVRETSDRGKEANVLLDWTDSDLLKELVRLRIVSNGLEESLSIQNIWPRLCISHFRGEESLQYLIDRSMMRPRFLINVINQCKSFAINLNHSKIEEDDIVKGLSAYSTDLITDIGYEIRDVSPDSEDILYAFIESSPELTKSEVLGHLKDFSIKDEDLERLLELLIWYGFLGLRVSRSEVKYIYNFNYNMQLPKGILRKNNDRQNFVINPAFWPALLIVSV